MTGEWTPAVRAAKPVFFTGALDSRTYVATLNRRGKLDVRCAAAYQTGPHDTRRLTLSAYVSAAGVNAGKRGGAVRNAGICVEREFVVSHTSEEEQARRLEFMATIAATRIGTDFEHRLPISTRKPK